MKKNTLILFLFVLCYQMKGQPVLFGTTNNTISKYDTSTNNLTAAYTFRNMGISPDNCNSLCKANDGKLYGMTTWGGSGFGAVFSYAPLTGAYTKLKDFNLKDGATPSGSLIQASDGKFYGMTKQGGSVGYGVIFSYDPLTNIYNILKHFNYSDGANPENGSLVQASNGKLYGMTSRGGSNGIGVIFSCDPSTGSYAMLKDFTGGSDGAFPKGGIIQASDGKLYGMTSSGGKGYGIAFSYDPSTGNYAKLWDFDRNNGAYPKGSLLQASDGKLYGMASGGDNNKGVIFSYTPSTGMFSKLKDFNDGDGAISVGSLLQASDGKLYGLTPDGGIGSRGVAFSYDPSTGSYNKLKDFDFNCIDGGRPSGNLVQASDGKLYGMTTWGGSSCTDYNPYGFGVIFSYDPSISSYTKLMDFNAGDGWFGSGMIQANNGKFYGMTYDGGNSNMGVVFSYDPITSNYVKLKDFNKSDGAKALGGLVQAKDGKLYGMTSSGGSNNYGVIFSYDTSLAKYSKLMDFNGIDGGTPYLGSLFQASNGKLYGMTYAGGSSGNGVIFSYDPLMGNYSKLKDFNDSDGANPQGSLIQANDGKLYGMTSMGGIGAGVIFSFDPSTSTYTKLKDFNINDGSYPCGSLVQASDGQLYGMTNTGGQFSGGFGVVFSYASSTGIYSVLKDFSTEDYNVSSEGGYPYGSLIQASDGKLYGMTSHGGSSNGGVGVVFSYDIVSNAYSKLKDFDGENGAWPTYGGASLIEYKPLTPTLNIDNLSDLQSTELSIVAYPNPTKNNFNLVMRSSCSDPITFSVFDIEGRLIYSVEEIIESNFQFGGNFPRGTYIIEVRQGDERVLEKVIKN